jgi:ABC-type transporter Mla subunit MlaD
VDGAQQTLAVTASHNRALAQALQLTPPALDSTLATNRKLDTTLSALDPLVAELRPGARLLAPATTVLAPMLTRLRTVLDDAQPLLRAAPSALGRLASMSRQGVPLIAGLNPVIRRLNGDLIPFLSAVDPDTRLRLYETIGPLASALSSSASLFDANGYTYNFDVQFSSGSVLLPCATGPSGTELQQCLLVQNAIRALLGRMR